jgi:hypothetical protein
MRTNLPAFYLPALYTCKPEYGKTYKANSIVMVVMEIQRETSKKCFFFWTVSGCVAVGGAFESGSHTGISPRGLSGPHVGLIGDTAQEELPRLPKELVAARMRTIP